MPEGWILSQANCVQHCFELRKCHHIAALIMHRIFSNICSIILVRKQLLKTVVPNDEGDKRKLIKTRRLTDINACLFGSN